MAQRAVAAVQYFALWVLALLTAMTVVHEIALRGGW
jgi:hypothetical protein